MAEAGFDRSDDEPESVRKSRRIGKFLRESGGSLRSLRWRTERTAVFGRRMRAEGGLQFHRTRGSGGSRRTASNETTRAPFASRTASISSISSTKSYRRTRSEPRRTKRNGASRPPERRTRRDCKVTATAHKSTTNCTFVNKVVPSRLHPRVESVVCEAASLVASLMTCCAGAQNH